MRTPGVEPGSQAWEACMMPLHYMRSCREIANRNVFAERGGFSKNGVCAKAGSDYIDKKFPTKNEGRNGGRVSENLLRHFRATRGMRAKHASTPTEEACLHSWRGRWGTSKSTLWITRRCSPQTHLHAIGGPPQTPNSSRWNLTFRVASPAAKAKWGTSF